MRHEHVLDRKLGEIGEQRAQPRRAALGLRL
jgi:hypothetical protein